MAGIQPYLDTMMEKQTVFLAINRGQRINRRIAMLLAPSSPDGFQLIQVLPWKAIGRHVMK